MYYYQVIYIVTLLSAFGYAWNHPSIPYRRPCHELSPECLRTCFQAAIPVLAKGAPDLGLEPLDPYILRDLNLTLSGVHIHFSDGYAKGLKTCVVDFARIVDDTLETQVHCNLTIRGRYKSSGSLLMFPIDGEGTSSIKCDNLKLHSMLKLGIKIKNGRKFFYVKNAIVKHAYDGRVSYAMSNLVKGNHEMSKAILDFMNSNWRLIAEEVGTPVVDYGVKSIMKNVRQFLEVFSIEDLNSL